MRIITGKYKGRSIKTTSGPGYRPATARVRESLFSTLESLGIDWPQTRVMDIFAGSGSLAMESLSRGAMDAWFIEKSNRAAGLIRQNLKMLGVPRDQWRVICKDLFRFIEHVPDIRFQLAFIDPPYGKDLLIPAVDRILSQGLLDTGALLCAEVEIYVDCCDLWKDELVLEREKKYGQTRIYIWRLQGNG